MTYHNLDHTDYVIEKAIFLAKELKVSAQDLHLLKLAALFHDTGFIDNPKDHEQKGCKIAKGYLEEGYTHEELQKNLRDDHGYQNPAKSYHAPRKYPADADLEYLGTDLFEKIGKTLYEELKHFNPDFTEQAWDELQLVFMQKHHFHTEYCQKHREPKKQENLLTVKKRLGVV